MEEFEHMNETINNVILEKQMQRAYLDYSMSVIVSRALPDVRDGLKPVHRRILYGMHLEGMTPDKPTVKSANLVGFVMGKFHPHGDTAIYDAVVRLAQPFNTRYMLVEGQGNFGSIDGDSAAAMRYTEVRMTDLAQEMLRDINKDTVEFGLNYDEKMKEPTVLPSRFPNLLVNGSTGIAVGMATNMAPHNLNEVIDGVTAYLDDPSISIADLMKSIKGPDFPTGGQIMGKSGIKEAYETGRGRVIMRAVAEIEKLKNRHAIVITELPYQVNKAALVKKIADLVKDKQIDGISYIADQSGRDGIRIVIECKRDANPHVLLNNLYKQTQLQSTFGIINLALVNGVPKILNLKELIGHYVDHQKDVVTRRTQFDLDRAEKRAHILEGLKIAIDNIDRIIEIVRGSQNDQEAKDKMEEEFQLTDAQSQAILDMRIRRLTGLSRENLEIEYAELLKNIAWYKEILGSEKILIGIIKEELEEIKTKYGDERRTVIEHFQGELEDADLIEEEDVVITMTNFGYIKRMPEGTYKPQKRGGQGISALTRRDEDFVSNLYITSTHDTILFFTNKGRVYSLKAYQVPQAGRTAKGTAVVNLINLQKDETIQEMMPVKSFGEEDSLVFVTKDGLIKKTLISEYSNIRSNGLNAIQLNEGDELVTVRQSCPGDEYIVVTKEGMAIRFTEDQVRNIGRNGQGVKAISLDDQDQIVSMDIVKEDNYLLAITENGFGKMTELNKYKVQRRGGKGLITYKINKKTGPLVSGKVVDKKDEIMMISQSGTIIRLETKDISVLGRSTSGVKLMNIKDSNVVSVAKYLGE